ncbi:hypothetical protein LX32DRAFT_281223 [Colletotrichum zoysiae]|uniref:Uncharacterized protein n=1 Tax=Colletotrichum zoysiae TaxID=1216348 RepID=A0AAD9H356_9PEZI|nr:hypothetical protein LX32DRAFT_281223 [Colletotrichum zoysiae]
MDGCLFAGYIQPFFLGPPPSSCPLGKSPGWPPPRFVPGRWPTRLRPENGRLRNAAEHRGSRCTDKYEDKHGLGGGCKQTGRPVTVLNREDASRCRPGRR